MDDLLTTREVQEILKVDRITVYRMLQDGRLKGVKIGQQWRFPAGEVHRMLARQGMPAAAESEPKLPTRPGSQARGAFPTHCVQVIQDLYAELGKIGAITVDVNGAPLTEASLPCRFCAMMLSSSNGQEACRRSWAEAAQTAACTPMPASAVRAPAKPGWFTCHAGLRYQMAAIYENGAPAAFLVSGQVAHGAADAERLVERVSRLAEQYNLPADELMQAAQEIPAYDDEKCLEMENWPAKFTRAIESILNERAGLVGKLQMIAEITKGTNE